MLIHLPKFTYMKSSRAESKLSDYKFTYFISLASQQIISMTQSDSLRLLLDPYFFDFTK